MGNKWMPLADLTGADLGGADFREADLYWANLHQADLTGADLGGAILRAATLSEANLTGANLKQANLKQANLKQANLKQANLEKAALSEADLFAANLHQADLSGADLSGADLRWADLSGADLSGADLRYADLLEANLSGVMGLLDPVEWLQDNFVFTKDGIMVYKRIGPTAFDIPDYWHIEPGSTIKEEVHPARTMDCACGVSFGTLEWCKNHYERADLWKCQIHFHDLAGVVVPYNTDGEARCSRLQLIDRRD